ncbi:MAG: hypothetical protein AAGD13_19545 [Pseudomonadota bacterium]
MLRLALIAASFGLSACASASITPPQQKVVNKSLLIPLHYEETWRKSVAWFANRNIIIDKIQKESGLIAAKYRLSVNDGVVDCGNISISGLIGAPEIEKYANLNVVLAPSGSSTSVTMNIFGDFLAVGRDAWDGRSVRVEGDCISTGILEAVYFREIS